MFIALALAFVIKWQSCLSIRATTNLDLEDAVDSQDEVIDSCCCKAGPCPFSFELLGLMDPQKGGIESAVPQSVFTPGVEGFRRACCKKQTKCEKPFSYSLGADRCKVRPPSQEDLVDQCAGRISEWLFDDSYFTALPGIGELSSLGLLRMGTLGKAYQTFLPCTMPAENYLEVLFNDRNLLDPEVSFNPFKKFVLESLPPCRQLVSALPTRSEKIAAAGAAALASFKKECPFEVQRAAYAVDQDPKYACGYDKLTRETFFGLTATCPEGSRCACPIIDEDNRAFRQDSITGALSGQLAINRQLRKLQNIVPLVLFGISPMASAVYSKMYSQYAGALEGTLRGVAVAGSIITAVSGTISLNSCTLRIGCFVFDCKKTSKGCRLVPARVETDFRSLYFMMPPPLQSCSWGPTDGLDGCRLDICSLPDLRAAKVGLNSTPKGKKNYSGVFNCQALAYRDMKEEQVEHFAERTKAAYDEAQTPKHQMLALRQTYLRFCPWEVRSLASKQVRCLDLDTCDVVANPSCCMNLSGDSSNMDNICPKNHILCQAESDETQRCVKINRDNPEATCGTGTRWKPCPQEEECPFAISFPASGYIQCNDLSIVSTSQEDKTNQGWCATRQGIRKCPLEKPWMCAGKECKGENCCEKKAENCAKRGGLRYCPVAYRPQNTSTILERVNLVDTFDAAE